MYKKIPLGRGKFPNGIEKRYNNLNQKFRIKVVRGITVGVYLILLNDIQVRW